MYFSLLTPAPGHERAAARDWARGAYEEHQWLWRFFPAPAGTARRFLFRRRDVDGLPRFYVVADREPQSPTADWAIQCKPYDPQLREGDLLDFELRVNPVVAGRDATGKAHRHDVVMQEKKRLLEERGHARWSDWSGPDRPALADLVHRTCAAWLAARCARLGFEIDPTTLRAEGYQQCRGKGEALRFSTVDLSGRFKVSDTDALRTALCAGVGHGKAFGCGLLLVRPPNR